MFRPTTGVEELPNEVRLLREISRVIAIGVGDYASHSVLQNVAETQLILNSSYVELPGLVDEIIKLGCAYEVTTTPARKLLNIRFLG